MKEEEEVVEVVSSWRSRKVNNERKMTCSLSVIEKKGEEEEH